MKNIFSALTEDIFKLIQVAWIL